MTGPIAVATDFSARADRAIDRAIMLGKYWGTPVTLIHALDRKAAEKADRAELDRQMRNALPEGIEGAAKVEFLYPQGSAPKAISEAADEIGASLVVMGPARHNSVGDFFLGTSVDYALRQCDEPVLIVKQRPHKPYRRAVVATDFSKPSANALKLALEWFPDMPVDLVHACHVPFESWQSSPEVKDEYLKAEETGMTDFVAGLGLSPEQSARVETHTFYGSAHQAVKEAVIERGADLVVIGSHGESGFRHATIGSMANALLETNPADTLMVTTRG